MYKAGVSRSGIILGSQLHHCRPLEICGEPHPNIWENVNFPESHTKFVAGSNLPGLFF